MWVLENTHSQEMVFVTTLQLDGYYCFLEYDFTLAVLDLINS